MENARLSCVFGLGSVYDLLDHWDRGMGPIGWVASSGQQAVGYVCGGLCWLPILILLVFVAGVLARGLGRRD